VFGWYQDGVWNPDKVLIDLSQPQNRVYAFGFIGLVVFSGLVSILRKGKGTAADYVSLAAIAGVLYFLVNQQPQIRWYGLLYAAALMGGFYIWRWQMLRGGFSEQQAERFLLMGVLAVIIGARFGHVAFYGVGHAPDATFFDKIWDYIAFWKGGLASHGSTIALILILIYYARTESIPILEVIDRFAMSAAWGAIVIRIGNLMNSEIVGRKVDPEQVWLAFKFPQHDRGLPIEQVPWRHPSQLYEAGMAMVILAVLWAVDRYYGEKRPRGILAGGFLLLYFVARFTVEFFKEFQTLSPDNPLTRGQQLSLPFIAIGVFILIRTFTHRIPTRTDEQLAEQAAAEGAAAAKAAEA
jgi:prolipoprotein diacylglyceryl transferase